MGINLFEFNLFKGYSELCHGVFARSGGVSSGRFDSLNLGLSVGDDPEAVKENRGRILEKMELQRAVYLEQVHGKTIHVLTEDDGQAPIVADGVVTQLKGIALVIQVADCQGVLLYDPEQKVIANVHSGWRGSVENIIGDSIDVMATRFKSDPKDIRAGISPSLGPCCAEFVNYRDEMPEAMWSYKSPDRPCFDFWALSCDQMTAKGMKKENIETMNICTHCSTDQFYSYRREKKTGRFGCVISLKR